MSFFPMRPSNGGHICDWKRGTQDTMTVTNRFLASALSHGRRAEWVVQPKYNGERVLYDAHKDELWNRHGDRFRGGAVLHDYQRTILRSMSRLLRTEWFDMELMGGKTKRYSDCHAGFSYPIILDVPAMRGSLKERLIALSRVVDPVPLNGVGGVGTGDGSPEVVRAQNFFDLDVDKVYDLVKHFIGLNASFDDMVYEGFVVKDLAEPYKKMASASKETTKWVKHRFARNS